MKTSRWKESVEIIKMEGKCRNHQDGRKVQKSSRWKESVEIIKIEGKCRNHQDGKKE